VEQKVKQNRINDKSKQMKTQWKEALHENPLILALTQFAHRWKAGEGWGSGAI